MEKPRLLFQVAALCSSLILVTGYVAYRAGALHQAALTQNRIPLTQRHVAVNGDAPIQSSDTSIRLNSVTGSDPSSNPRHSASNSTIFNSPASIEDTFGNRANFFSSNGAINQISAVQTGESHIADLQVKLAQFATGQPFTAGIEVIGDGAVTLAQSDEVQTPVKGMTFGPTKPLSRPTTPPQISDADTAQFYEVARRLSMEPPRVMPMMSGSKSMVIVTTWDHRVPTVRDYALDFFNQHDKNKNGILTKVELPQYIWQKLKSMDATTDDHVNWRVLAEQYAEFDNWLSRQK